ncbi:Phosphoglycerate mutase-like protein 4 [Hibiscus syriacus]|uniref:Phosphoglycerate mutase-like protein 4 n=1 Tax=Hibiscus syriacus TaxID=106335 RepID=A0A6A2XBH8_HIBSY|nr:Phosphoglycerate mutase-like protein 4 [Hibiscus syriacus]
MGYSKLSVVRTHCSLGCYPLSPGFSAGSVEIAVCVKSPAPIETLLRANLPNQRFALTRHSTHLVNPPHSLPMDDSKSSCMDGSYAEIVVVRHGETEWNADGRIQGHLDVELNEAGKQQAVLVADQLSKEPKISAVYSSDLKRALVTAETIAARCGGLEVITDPDLRERNLGDLQGLVLREAAKHSPKAHKAFLSHRTDQDIPGGGESLDHLFQRCTSSLQRIGKKHKGSELLWFHMEVSLDHSTSGLVQMESWEERVSKVRFWRGQTSG